MKQQELPLSSDNRLRYAQEFKKILAKGILDKHGKQMNSENTAVLFSGGTDSTSCVLTLLENDIRPYLFNFYLYRSNGDYLYSIDAANKLGLADKLYSTKISNDLDLLASDIKFCISKFKTSRKTHIQCIQPFIHVFKDLKKYKRRIKYVVTGLRADTLYGTPRSLAIKYGSILDPTVFANARKILEANPLTDAYKLFVELAKDHGLELVVPYSNIHMRNFLCQFNWKQLNHPYQKWLVIQAFSYYYDKLKLVYRKNSNLQVGTGLRELHDRLLSHPINKNHRNNIQQVYSDILKYGTKITITSTSKSKSKV